MAQLKLLHINKIYEGGVHAVKDFSLDVEDKEFVVFVGPSGCGKSTALRMIAGLEKITSGDAYIGDKLVNGLPPKDRNVAMVFQSYALFPNMSVYDNISFGLRMQGESKEVIDEKVTAAAEMLGLSEYLTRKPAQLSGGQKQRVALGRAIVRRPDVFLLDEPLSNLDAKLRNKMRNEISALHRKLDATFIYVTHDQTEAMTMGDKIVVMKNGEIMQIGTPAYLYRYPGNKFVAGFIGTPQMNFWQGKIAVNNDNVSVKTAVGEFSLLGELRLRLDPAFCVDGKEVIVGLRPEDLRTERQAPTDVEIETKISVVEDLCTHTIVYGDSNGEEVVGRGKSYSSPAVGETVVLYADKERLHLFDKYTEESVLPEYAVSKTVSGTKEGDKLFLLGGEVVLSKGQAEALRDGKVTVTIPYDAYTTGKGIPMVCKRAFCSEKSAISLLSAAGEEMYAKGDFTDKESFGIDVSKIRIVGSVEINPVKEQSWLTFTYQKRKEKENNRTVVKHYCVFDKGETEAFYEFNKKMYRLGKSVFDKKYRMLVSINDVRVAAAEEVYPCFDATVLERLDYGKKQYSLVSVGEDTLYVAKALPVGKTVRLAINLDGVSVAAENSETILF